MYLTKKSRGMPEGIPRLLLFDRFLQVLSRLELGDLLSWYLYLLLRLRIEALARLSLYNQEGAKANQRNSVTLFQCGCD